MYCSWYKTFKIVHKIVSCFIIHLLCYKTKEKKEQKLCSHSSFEMRINSRDHFSVLENDGTCHCSLLCACLSTKALLRKHSNMTVRRFHVTCDPCSRGCWVDTGELPPCFISLLLSSQVRTGQANGLILSQQNEWPYVRDQLVRPYGSDHLSSRSAFCTIGY